MALSAKEIAAYRRDGYLVIPEAIDARCLEKLRTVIDTFREASRRATESNMLFDLGPGHSAATPQLRRLKNAAHIHPDLTALMKSDTVLDLVAPLLGGTVRFDHSKINFKPPGGKAAIAWHQDWAFFPQTNDDLLTLSVFIEDVTPNNGPLMVIPGSHKGPILDHHHEGTFAGGVEAGSLGDLLEHAVPLTGPAGTVTVHHVRTLHASGENRSDRERPLLFYSYAAVDAFPIFHRYDWDSFESRILRGASTVVPRVTQVPMRIPYPRAATADSIYDKQAIMPPEATPS